MGRRRRDRMVLGAASAARAATLVGLAGPDDGAPQPTLTAELTLARGGWRCVAGADEVGRGALAGPVVAAAVILPPVTTDAEAADLLLELAGARDSKQIAPAERQRLAGRVYAVALGVGVAAVPAAVIDALGIGPANRLALRLALANLPHPPDFALLDAVTLPDLDRDQAAVIRGDQRCLSIAAASIVAKVTRDALLDGQAPIHPVYGFERHKGYGTAEHLAALTAHGPCILHRRCFAPVRHLVAGLLAPPAGQS